MCLMEHGTYLQNSAYNVRLKEKSESTDDEELALD